MIRFIHCADLHFDRPFEGVAAIQEDYEFSQYNQQTLAHIVDLAIAKEVDFVLFAGDTFHQNRPTLKTQRLFFEEMNRLAQVDIAVYLAFGNHDFYDPTRYWFEFPENVHLYTNETVETLIYQNAAAETCAISAFSYTTQWIDTKKVAEYPLRAQTDYHIAMYHGEMGSTRYAPFQLSEMQKKGYDYWALGHIHVPMVLQAQPPILYAGTPMGHSQKEDQVKGVVCVTLAKGQPASYQFHEVAQARWAKQVYSLADIRDKKTALQMLRQPFETTQPTFYQLIVRDTQEMPAQWLDEHEKEEVIAYLNRHATQTQQWIYALNLVDTKADARFTFPIAKDQIIASLEQIANPEAFEAIIEDLRKQPQTSRLVSSDSFRMTVLEQVYAQLAMEFSLKEGE